jgi:hypothetical protein
MRVGFARFEGFVDRPENFTFFFPTNNVLINTQSLTETGTLTPPFSLHFDDEQPTPRLISCGFGLSPPVEIPRC